MQASAKKSAASKPAAPARPAMAEAKGGSNMKQSLRGKGLAEQEAMLTPPGSAPENKGDNKSDPLQAGPKKGTEKLPPTQPGPHLVQVPGAGRWILAVERKEAFFNQRVSVLGAAEAKLPTDGHPPVGETVEVKAEGPWALKVEHSAPPGTEWAKDRTGSWHPSSHRGVVTPDYIDVATEDFKDNDFNDLVLSVIRIDEQAGEGDGLPDQQPAYLVESETKVVGYETAYDLVLGACASGRLDVRLNAAIATPDELGTLDAQTLAAMSERFASFGGKVGSSPEHAEKKASLMAEIGAWQAAIAKQRAMTRANDAKR